MGIRILLYHTRMFVDFAPMLHKLASRCIIVAFYVQCMQKNAKVWTIQLILPIFHTRFARTKLAAVAPVFDYILVMHIT